jgi:adenylosuccinate lyase
VQKNAMRAWREKEDFKDLLLRDNQLVNHLSTEEIEECFNVGHDLRNVDYIFDRVFSD